MKTMRMPTVYQCNRHILTSIMSCETQLRSGRYVPARPMAFPHSIFRCRLIERLRRSWLVFTGKVDILEWEADYAREK